MTDRYLKSLDNRLSSLESKLFMVLIFTFGNLLTTILFFIKIIL